ncbi:Hsp20/alpha crystallin family protein [Candidatus Protochlamydia phocaeensis]|uniref:Hsp20/alpha crystallin family protein n=1 Tax=Candidatus Protochlamydia phocaeensis TaxID=1414722 RepID=UPI000838FC42|nr:Hsp20/alpha crystallin family protein [Candidatus Protochlamydia phocaeensis]
MRCCRHDQRYMLLLQSSRSSCGDWQREKFSFMMGQAYWHPAGDVYETDSKIYLTLELAGIDAEKLEISLYTDALVIKGQRSIPLPEKKGNYHQAEIRQGPFCFELPLNSPVDSETVDLFYEKGFLSIVLRKQEVKS